MKFLLAACLLFAPTTAFQMSMNSHRSPLSHQYKSITSVHNSLISGNNGGMIRMAPPPGEPEPEPRRGGRHCRREWNTSDMQMWGRGGLINFGCVNLRVMVLPKHSLLVGTHTHASTVWNDNDGKN
eukprot:scaffold35788_cov183-Skeletonema_marinoi.AAC.1